MLTLVVSEKYTRILCIFAIFALNLKLTQNKAYLNKKQSKTKNKWQALGEP